MATAVKTFTGIPNKNHERTAVNINSKALANVFKIELSERRNMAVTIPMAPLLRTISKTLTVKVIIIMIIALHLFMVTSL